MTVAATILALFPLASEGGPLWQPMCYAQIGGLAVPTFVTLLLVPVLYSIAVLDLKVVQWTRPAKQDIDVVDYGGGLGTLCMPAPSARSTNSIENHVAV